jgi:hypothetical protein
MHEKGRKTHSRGAPATPAAALVEVAVLIASYLLIVFLVPLLISGVATYRALPRGRSCALCGGSTLRVTGRAHRLLGRLVPALERRWCPPCQWEGYVRGAEPRAGRAERPAGSGPGRATATPSLALDVRTLRVDGGLWRVQLQWWREAVRCEGRMVFIAPTGRRLRDGVQCFSGATPFEVLGQALSIPDGMLVSRVRQLLVSRER